MIHTPCRLCVTEYVESSVSGAINCPQCDTPLTVDLSSKPPGREEEEEEGAKAQQGGRGKKRKARSGGAAANTNRAGTVLVAGKIKVM